MVNVDRAIKVFLSAAVSLCYALTLLMVLGTHCAHCAYALRPSDRDAVFAHSANDDARHHEIPAEVLRLRSRNANSKPKPLPLRREEAGDASVLILASNAEALRRIWRRRRVIVCALCFPHHRPLEV